MKGLSCANTVGPFLWQIFGKGTILNRPLLKVWLNLSRNKLKVLNIYIYI